MGSRLCVEGLSKDFEGLRAVDRIDMEAEEGEIIGLIGPNGAGKSTFFNCLSGDLKPTEGRITFAGQDITYRAPDRRARLGIARTYQIPLTFNHMTVLENTMVGGFMHQVNRKTVQAKALQVLEFVGLHERAMHMASTLGTPDRKRLEIARALSTEPKILLLDEALAGLTAVETKQAITLLRRINERGITLLIVEHVLEVIMTLASRVLVFHQGGLLTQGTPAEVVANPKVQEAYLGKRG